MGLPFCCPKHGVVHSQVHVLPVHSQRRQAALTTSIHTAGQSP